MSEFNLQAFRQAMQQLDTQPQQHRPEVTAAPSPEQQVQLESLLNTVAWQEGFIAGLQAHRSRPPQVMAPNMYPVYQEVAKRNRHTGAAVLAVGAILLGGVYLLREDIKEYLNQQTATQLTEQGAGGAPVYKRLNAGEQPEPLLSSGTDPLIEQQNTGQFISGTTNVSWRVLVADEASDVYSIELAIVSPAGGYEPDANFAERIATGDITNQELALFLVKNNIIPSTSRTSGVFVELVGRTEAKDGQRVILQQLQLLP